MTTMQEAHDWMVAATIATEVPPIEIKKTRPDGATTNFTREMIEPTIRCVADVIRCRTADPHFPDTAIAVVLQRNQFSAVCREDYWRRAVSGDWQLQHLRNCLGIWREGTSELVALYYYSPISMVPPFREPSWAARLTEVLVDGIDRDYFRWYR